MEWVETTGRTVEEAVEFALDQLGVDEADAEYEVLEEPKTGLFGRMRSEARVRARVRPSTPRQKEERRSRGRKATKASAPVVERKKTKKEPEVTEVEPSSGEDVPLAEQGEVAAAFVRGVLERFGAPESEVSTHELDAETLEVRVEGGDLGLLIGQKGATLQSLQELTRTVVQRQTGARTGRILVDVSGYRARRKEALERFARKIAEDVLSADERVVLEPMSPADRKVIHDTINTIDGVVTSSEGEEPRRRVVVSPG
jgi:spoIIIJ-associated protein